MELPSAPTVASPAPLSATRSLRTKLSRVEGPEGEGGHQVRKFATPRCRTPRSGEKKGGSFAEEKQLRGGRSGKCARRSRKENLAQEVRKMSFPTIFSGRRVIVKVFLLHFIAWKASNAAPSPIIRFPGDDTPRTDKEVALVSPAGWSHRHASLQTPLMSSASCVSSSFSTI